MKNKTLKGTTEYAEFQRALEKPAFKADEEFKYKLREDLVSSLNSPQKSNFNLFKAMEASTKKWAYIGSGAIGLVLIGTLSTWAILNLGDSSNIKPTSKTAEEVFAAMMNSTKPSIEPTRLGDSGSKLAAGSGEEDAMMYPYFAENTFTHSKVTTTAGPKANVCYQSVPYGLSKTTMENFSFFNSTVGNLYKTVSYDGDGGIYSYYTGDGEYSYEYFGGDYVLRVTSQGWLGALGGQEYAVKDAQTDTEVDSVESSTGEAEDPDQTVVSPTEPNVVDDPVQGEDPGVIDEPVSDGSTTSITDMYGPDAELLGEEEINGKTYYVTSWSTDMYCDDTSSKKFVFKTWVEADTYNYFKEELYVSAIADENLVVSNQYEYEEEVTTYDTVSSNFELDINKPFRDIDYDYLSPYSDEYKAALKMLLEENGLYTAVPVDSSFILSDYYSEKVDLPNPDEVRLERALYRSDSVGQKMYEEYKSYQTDIADLKLYLSTYFYSETGGSYKPLSVEIYDKTIPADALDERMYYGMEVDTESFIFAVGDENVSANLYTIRYDTLKTEPGSAEGSEGSGEVIDTPPVNTDEAVDNVEPIEFENSEDCPDCMEVTESYVVNFTWHNAIYVIRFDNGYTKDEVKAFDFNVYNSSNATELNNFMDLLDEVENNPVLLQEKAY